MLMQQSWWLDSLHGLSFDVYPSFPLCDNWLELHCNRVLGLGPGLGPAYSKDMGKHFRLWALVITRSDPNVHFMSQCLKSEIQPSSFHFSTILFLIFDRLRDAGWNINEP